jgi:3-hydroxybutyryl-CoA dehydrogenase
MLDRIAVIGAGTMGHGFAQVFAASGRSVALADRSVELAERGKRMIEANLGVVVEEGFLEAADAPGLLERVRVASDLEDAVADASLVIEAVAEDMEIKVATWRRLSAAAPEDAILASNTSSYDIGELAAVVGRRPERVLGTHWFNPPQIVPCVEVIPAPGTLAAVVESVVALLREVGKEPVVVKSVPGFVANRIQNVMAAEALRCLEQGLATAEDIDAIVRGSFGFRLGAYGPLRIADLAGLDTYLGVYDYLFARLRAAQYEPPDVLRRLVEEGRTGVKALGGIYDYTEEEADRLRAERDRILYRRLRGYLAERE